MEYSNLKNKFVKCLSASLSDHKFKFSKSQSRFVRKKEFGEEWYTINYLSYEDQEGFEINTGLHIRFNQVESIFHETSSFSVKDSKGTSTIGCSVENYLGDSVDTFRQVIVDTFDTLNELDLLINSNPKSKLPLIHPIFRGSKGLIIDYLIGSKNSKFLIEIYSNSYTEFANGFYKDEFNGVVNNLNSKIT